MPIYTKTGDDGKTSLFGGKRISKSDILIEAYGTVDELQAFMIFTISKIKNNNDKQLFLVIVKDLYKIMSILAGAKKYTIDDVKIREIENYIDEINKKLPKIKEFIIFSNPEISCLLNLCRVICRRAERKIVRYISIQSRSKNTSKIIVYLNRLSDLLFVASRLYNTEEEFTV